MTRSNIQLGGQELKLDADGDTSITADTDDTIHFKGGGSDRATIDTSGHLLVGKTSSSGSNAGAELRSNGRIFGTSDGAEPLFLNRLTDNGTMATFRKDGSEKGTINNTSDEFTLKSVSGLTLESNDSSTQRRLFLSNGSFKPYNADDNTLDLGLAVGRWNDVFATNGTIQTSDQNEKQDIADLTAKELNVANKLSALFKTYRWKDAVVKKGDKARTHSGIVAQDIQSAFSAEGLDASNYGLFTSDTWTDDDGKEQTRLGVRYPELFSFIFSSIEARLTALESK